MLMTPLDLEITWAFPGKHVAATPVDEHASALVLTLPAEPPVPAQFVDDPAWETTFMPKDKRRVMQMSFGFILILYISKFNNQGFI